jgi:hypothetical protein
MVFTNVAASLFPKLESGENQAPVLNAPRVATTVLLLFALLISAMLYGGHLLIFIDLTSLFCLAIFTIVPVFVEKVREGRSLLESKLLAARDYSLATTVIGILMAWIGILMNHGDPSAIGPCVSIGFLISFYAGLIFMMSTMLYRASTGREIPHLGLTSTAYAVLATFATGSCYAYIFFLF